MVRISNKAMRGFLLKPIWFALFFALSPAAYAGLQEGLDAYNSGNYAVALKELAKLAGNGDATAQLYIGMMNENGQGVPQNYKKAADQYGYSANQGKAEAQYHLGVLYELGKGVPQDRRWPRHGSARRRPRVMSSLAQTPSRPIPSIRPRWKQMLN